MAFPGTYNFNYYVGDTFEFIISPKDATGVALDMTPYMYNVTTNPNNVKFRIANKRGHTPTPTFYTTGTAVVNDTDNIVLCKISASTGSTLVSGTLYYYDVQISDNTNIYTILTGTSTPTDDVYGV